MAGRSLQASSEGITKSVLALARYGLNQKALAEDLGLSRHTVGKFFKGVAVDRDNFASICERLGLELENCVFISHKPVVFTGDDKKQQNALALQSIDVEQALRIASSINQPLLPTVSSINLISDPPLVDKWQGRTKEIQTLQDWLVGREIKFIGIQGLSGIGKSWLASYIYDKKLDKSEFSAFFWADMSQMPDFIVFVQNALIRLNYNNSSDIF